MPRHKQFMVNGPRPKAVLEDDIAALYEREHPAERRETRALPVDLIRPNPFQARRSFVGVDELAEAMRRHGFTSWLRVRPDPSAPGFFQLVYGERRLRAARTAGLADVPCEIVAHTDEQMIEIGLAENIQRQDLDPLEEAQMFRTLITQRGYSQRSLAERIGKDKGYVENRLALLRTPEDVQQMVTTRPESMSAARAIAKVPTAAERRPLIDGVLAGRLTKQDVYVLVNQTRAVPATTELPRAGAVTNAAQATAVEPSPREMHVDRQLQRDISLLRTILARWKEAPPPTTPGRQQMRAYLEDEVRPNVEALLLELRDTGRADGDA